MEVARIDEQGRAVRVPQWIIDLEAPVDVTALIRHNEDEGAVIVQARQAVQMLEGAKGLEDAAAAANQMSPATEPADSQPDDKVDRKEIAVKGPTFEQVSDRAKSYGIDRTQYEAYADQRWGRGWRLNACGRQHAYDELERYRNDPKGYLDKIDCAMQGRA